MAKRKKRAKTRFDRTGAKRLATRPRTKKAQAGDRRSKALRGGRRLRTGFVDVRPICRVGPAQGVDSVAEDCIYIAHWEA